MNRITMAILAIMACLWLYSLPVLALPEGAVARLGKGMISLQKRPIALSPDGSLLAVATSLGIYLYNTTTYVEIGFIETDEGMSSVAFSPDGHLLAGGGLDDRIPVKLWDVSGLQLVKTLTDTYHYSCYSVVFSPDGQLLATCSLLGDVVLWDVSSGQRVRSYRSGRVVDFSPDSRLLAAPAGDVVLLWDVPSGQLVKTLEEQKKYLNVKFVTFSPDGKLLASVSGDGYVTLWDVSSGQLVGILGQDGDNLESIAFSPDGELLASGGFYTNARNTLKLWDISSLQLAREFEHTDGVNSVTFSPDGHQLLTTNWFDGPAGVSVWDIASLQLVGTFEHPGYVHSVAFSPDGGLLASGDHSGTMSLWDIPNRQLVRTLKSSFWIVSVAFSPDGRLLASGGGNGLNLWDVSTGHYIERLLADSGRPLIGPVTCVAFSPDGRLLARGGHDTYVDLWDVSSRQLVVEFKHSDWIDSVAFSPDGRLLASAAYDYVVNLWDLSSLQLVETLRGNSESVAFSPDGSLLGSGGADGTILLWDVSSHQEVATLSGDFAIVESVAFSPDGSVLAGVWDNTVKLWDMASYRELATLTGHMDEVNSVAFSPDGSLLASGSSDGTVLLWDMALYKAPVVSDIPNQTIEEGETFTAIPLDDYVSDPDNADAEIVWTYDGNVELAVTISDERIASITVPDPEWSGSETITFTAADPDGLSDSDSAKFTVEAIVVSGDVNNDGKIRSNDAILALRIAAGLMEATEYQKQTADMNGDGKIRSNDAILILRKAAGLVAPGKSAIVNAGGYITVTLAEAHGVAGESITVPLKVDNVALAGGDISIGYNSAVLRAVDVSSDSDVLLASNVVEPGMLRIAFASADRLNRKTLAEIRFDILADDVSPLTLRNVKLYKPDALPIGSVKMDAEFSSWAIPPEHSALLQNFPNPFNPETWIPYQLAKDADVVIRIYDSTGRLIRKLDMGYKPAGCYLEKDRAAYWDGGNSLGERATSGVYFYQFEAGDFTAVRKLAIVK